MAGILKTLFTVLVFCGLAVVGGNAAIRYHQGKPIFGGGSEPTVVAASASSPGVVTTGTPAVVTAAASAPKVIAKPQITGVVPEYTEISVPKKVCQAEAQTQQVANPNKNGTVGGVVGGATGATGGYFAGQSLGGVWGGVAGAVVGAVGGAFAGNKIQKSTQPDTVAQTTTAAVCSTVMTQKRVLKGYDVTYSYNGETGTLFMKHRPRHLTVADINAADEAS